jgi:hypothetical protein
MWQTRWRVLYADDTSILCFKSNSMELITVLKIILVKEISGLELIG